MIEGGATNKGFLIDLLESADYRARRRRHGLARSLRARAERGPGRTPSRRWSRRRSSPTSARAQAARLNFFADPATIAPTRIPPSEGQEHRPRAIGARLPAPGVRGRLVALPRAPRRRAVVAAILREEGAHAARLQIGGRTLRVLYDGPRRGLRVEVEGRAASLRLAGGRAGARRHAGDGRRDRRQARRRGRGRPAARPARGDEDGDRLRRAGRRRREGGARAAGPAGRGGRRAAGDRAGAARPPPTRAAAERLAFPKEQRPARAALPRRRGRRRSASPHRRRPTPRSPAAPRGDRGASATRCAACCSATTSTPSAPSSWRASSRRRCPRASPRASAGSSPRSAASSRCSPTSTQLFVRAPRGAVGGELGVSNNARLRIFVRRMRARRRRHRRRVPRPGAPRARALRRVARSSTRDALERAVLRLLASQRSAELRHRLVLAVLRCVTRLAWTRHPPAATTACCRTRSRASPALRGLVSDAVADAALEARYVIFERPAHRARGGAHQQAPRGLARGGGGGADGAAEEVLRAPGRGAARGLRPRRRWIADADPRRRAIALAAHLRRLYAPAPPPRACVGARRAARRSTGSSSRRAAWCSAPPVRRRSCRPPRAGCARPRPASATATSGPRSTRSSCSRRCATARIPRPSPSRCAARSAPGFRPAA